MSISELTLWCVDEECYDLLRASGAEITAAA